MTALEEIGLVWTIGEDMTWLGKIFVYTIGLPFLVIFTAVFSMCSVMDFLFVKKERR